LPEKTPAPVSSEPCTPARALLTKVCVVEMKPATKAVYGSVCKEYCLPKCSLMSLFCWCCSDCADCGCGTVRTRNVLTKKTVPTCPVPTCVLKEVPVPCAEGGPPQP
jgi:hypothetical protein